MNEIYSYMDGESNTHITAELMEIFMSGLFCTSIIYKIMEIVIF